LLDRFGLMVELENCHDASERQRIVKARLAFDANPQAFCAAHEAAQRELATRIAAARVTLDALEWSDAVHERAAQLCVEAAVDGMRADLVMLRAARALAAFEGAARVAPEHVDQVADAVLAHRRRALPDQPQAGHSEAPPQSGNDTQHTQTEKPQSDSISDWGELPPEAVAAKAVKGVIPLPVKKR
jgi:magnesium chelatase subunit I